MAYVRSQAFDILDQSNNISRALVENGFIDTNTNRLTRYFILTINMRIYKLSGGSGQRQQEQGNPDRGFDRGT